MNPATDPSVERSTGDMEHSVSVDHPPGLARRWIGLGLLALGVLILLSAAWVGFRSYQAYRHLNAAADQVTSVQQQVKNLDDIDLER